MATVCLRSAQKHKAKLWLELMSERQRMADSSGQLEDGKSMEDSSSMEDDAVCCHSSVEPLSACGEQ
eukprot:12889356-Prorocentrum_lima.AAC.1